MVAKVGMAMLSGIEKVGSYVAKAIPGVGTAISKGLKVASKFTAKISNAIHANIGGKLGTATKVMSSLNKLPG